MVLRYPLAYVISGNEVPFVVRFFFCKIYDITAPGGTWTFIVPNFFCDKIAIGILIDLVFSQIGHFTSNSLVSLILTIT